MTTPTEAAKAAEQDPINAAILLLTEEADSISDCHTRTPGDWAGEPEAKAHYDHVRSVVDALSKLRAPVAEPAIVGWRDPDCGRMAQKGPPHGYNRYSEALMTVADHHALMAAALASAPVADTLPLEAALHVLVDKIVPGLDTGDLVHDAGRASAMLSGIMASAPVADERAANIHSLISRFRNATRDDAKNGGRAYFEAARAIEDELRQAVDALASAPVAGEAQPFMYGIMGPDGKAHFEEFCVSGDRDELQAEVVDHLNRDNPEDDPYSVVALFRNAALQASAEDDWKAAIRKFMDTAIPALAAIANVHTPDEIDALEAMPREPVTDQVRRLSQACEELSRQVRPERPKADKAAAPCTCPSGDGSLLHPCPAHPEGKPPAPSQPTDKEQA